MKQRRTARGRKQYTACCESMHLIDQNDAEESIAKFAVKEMKLDNRHEMNCDAQQNM